jgi:lipopolysaccharide export LptBFGC system permease protein LptF
MFGTLLNRLIFWELLKVFLMSLGTLTGLLVTAGLLQQAAQMGLTLLQVIKAIPLFIPNTLPYTIPATTLFASCVVYGRLSHDNEVVAIKGAGVHLGTILKPALLLGSITTIITAALSHTVIPVSQQLLFQQLTSDPEELLYNQLRRDRCIRHMKLPYVIYVKDVQGRRLIDVVLKERKKVKNPQTGQEQFIGYKMVARAREAKLRVDPTDGNLSGGVGHYRGGAASKPDRSLQDRQPRTSPARLRSESSLHRKDRGNPKDYSQYRSRILHAASPRMWMSVIRPTRLSRWNLGESGRLSEYVRNLFFAGTLRVLSVAFGRERDGQRW